jgi:hypothetical protein
MKTLMGTALAVALTSNAAISQSAQAPATVPPAQDSKIREFVTSENRTSVAVPASFRLSVGAEMPQSIELYEFDEGLGLGQHRYTIISGKTVIVDPGTRKIVRVLD